jgi:hypothetical protein
MVEDALAPPDAPEIEAKNRKAALHEHVEQLIGDLIVHRSAELRVRMEHDRDRRPAFPRRLKPAFKSPGGAREHDLRHKASNSV